MPVPLILQQRLSAQGFFADHSPEATVSALGALQAQDYNMALWAVGIRSGAGRAAVEAALQEGRLLRTHVLRPTWHLVAAQDIRWILALSGPVLLRYLEPTRRQFGLEAAQVLRAAQLFQKALPGQALTREELRPLLEGARIPTDEHRMAHLLMCAELEGLICSGPRRGKQATYQLLDERVPPAPPLAPEEALAQLARRYFRSRGPATLADFSWWSGFPQTKLRPVLEALSGELESCGPGFYRISTDPRPVPPLLLLPAFDEYLIAYRDRRPQLPDAHRDAALTRNGIFRPVVVSDGRVVGTWKPEASAAATRLSFDWFPGCKVPGPRRLAPALKAYRAFLGRPVTT